jgi:NDP-sugar pyrophosphorylase family protein
VVSEAIGWIPSACGPDRVGCRELEPGVWVSYHAHVDKGARLRGPCWIGKRSFIGDGAVIGPCAVVEDRCFVEKGVEIRDSIVGPYTFVGRHAEIANSIALGDTLIHRKSGSAARVPDPFVLCSLRRTASSGEEQGWLARMSELVARNKSDVQLIWKHFLMNREG